MNDIANFSIEEPRLKKLLQDIPKAKVGLIGDVCLDIYWYADMTKSELSRETPHFPLPVVKEVFSLGAAGNVASNISALQGKALHGVVSVIGEDWRGRELLRLFDKLGLPTDGLFTNPEMTTFTYCKPMRRGISDVVYEDPRLDFINRKPISGDTEQKVLAHLDKLAEEVDVLAVSDQFDCGVITDKVRERICEIGKTKTVVVDSRDRIHLYKNVIIKPNEVEAGRCVGKDLLKGDLNKNLLAAADSLVKKTSRPVVITLGGQGSFIFEGGQGYLVAAQKVEPPIDFVGAGDTFLSAFCCALGAGATGTEALAVGNLASAVVIQKIGTTGTATQAEITAQANH